MPRKSSLSGKPAEKESRTGIIASVDSTTKLLALISLVAEALFLGALAALPKDRVFAALIVCAIFLAVAILGILGVETYAKKGQNAASPTLLPSPLTPDSPPLSELVNSAIQTVCRAVSLPQSPEASKLRVFIFRKTGNELICSHHWAQNPVEEMVGKLRFDINTAAAAKVAVVRAVVDGRICRTQVEPLPASLPGYEGKVSKEVKFVLAAPIYGRDGDIWGTVDFDAGNDLGEALLSNEVSDATMFQLAQHLQIIFSLPSYGRLSGIPKGGS